MNKILKNVFFAFLADILGCCFVFAKTKSFDLKIFVIGFFFIFLFYIILDFIYYIYAKRSKNDEEDPNDEKHLS